MYTHSDREKAIWEASLPPDEKLLLLAINNIGSGCKDLGVIERLTGFTADTVKTKIEALIAKRILEAGAEKPEVRYSLNNDWLSNALEASQGKERL